MRKTRAWLWASTLLLAGCGDDTAREHPTERAQETEIEVSGAGGAALQVTERHPEEIRVGEPFAYRLRIENTSEQDITGLVVTPDGNGLDVVRRTLVRGEERTDPRRDAAAAPNANADANADQQNRSRNPDAGADARERWHIGTLAAGEAVTLEVEAVARQEGRFESCLDLDYDDRFCTTFDVVAPELELAQEVRNETIWLCDPLEVVYRVRNGGTGTTHTVVVEEQLPDGLATEDGERALRLEFEPLGPGESAERTVALVAQHGGSFALRPRASTEDLAVHAPTANVRVLAPELDLTVQTPESARIGQRVPVTITVANSGSDPAEDVQLVVGDTENVEAITLAGNRSEAIDGEIDIGRIEAEATRRFDLLLLPEDIEPLTARVLLRGPCLDDGAEVARMVEFDVTGVPAVRIEVVDENDPIAVGERVTYAIGVKNQGSERDLDIRLAGLLSDGLVIVGGEGASAVGGEGQQVQFGRLEQLDPGEEAEWQVVAEATRAGDHWLRLQLRSKANPKAIREEEPTTVTQ